MSEEGSARESGRADDELRPVAIETEVSKWAEGSVLIHAGDTRVLCTASVESRVPPFLAGSGRGWLTAEYSMLPRATSSRSQREVSRGRPSGRTAEIQRLIGRSLRAALDPKALGERTVTVDCDVLQADAGTRTAAITGGWVATTFALSRLFLAGDLPGWPVVSQITAVSVGIVGGRVRLDLDSSEDQRAEVDLNVVATVDGALVEVQGTGEQRSYTRAELDRMLDLAFRGVAELGKLQSAAVAERLEAVDERLRRGRRRPAAPRDERGVWGPPK